jgi:methionyl-tRNA formyltransferase
MKIGVVSNSKVCVPLLSYLINYNQAGVLFYLGTSAVGDVSKNELLAFCNANRLTVHSEEKKEELYQWQQFFEPDIIFISGYSHKVDTGMLSGVPKGVFNIHFGKLPEYRGPSPVFWQLKNGAPEIGLTIHHLADKFDSGDIVWQFFLKNEDHFSYSWVNYILGELQIRAVVELLQLMATNEPLKRIKQDESKAAYYSKPALKDVVINWDTMGTKEIVDLVKACNSWNIGPSTLINGYELKIMDANAVNIQDGADYAAGTILINNNSFHVACIKRGWLAVNFFNVNNTFIPARYAFAYGLVTGQKFQSNF